MGALSAVRCRGCLHGPLPGMRWLKESFPELQGKERHETCGVCVFQRVSTLTDRALQGCGNKSQLLPLDPPFPIQAIVTRDLV